MKKLTLILFIFSVGLLTAQSPVDKLTNKLKASIQSQQEKSSYLIWIYFTDKGNQIDKYYKDPSSVVTEKSLKRRTKVLAKESLVDFSDIPVNYKYISRVKDLGFIVRQKSKWFNSVSGYATKEQINQLAALEFVKKIDIVGMYKKSNDEIEVERSSNDLNKIELQPEGVHTLNYGISYTQLNLINVPAVHDLGYTGAGVTICVMDAGFNNLPHIVFNSTNIVDMWDFVNNDPNVADEGDMGSGSHGTYVLSVLGGFAQGDLIGPAYGANFLLAKTENTDSETPVEEDNWVAALEWADSLGVDITSTSLGYLGYDPPFIGYTWQDMDGNTALITKAADLAVKKGILVVNSAGNEGFDPSHNTLVAPADGDSVIAVGAVDGGGIRVGFSSVGPTVDGRIKPDVMAMGSGVYAARVSSTTGYTYVDGTSFSCPITSGACALILEANPNLSPIQVRELLKASGNYNSNPNNQYGWGVYNVLSIVTSVTSTNPHTVPEEFYLLNNFPNPFNPGTTIRYSIPVNDFVTIKLYDITGSEIRTLISRNVQAGTYDLKLDGSDLASGIYLVRMATNNISKTHKISLLK